MHASASCVLQQMASQALAAQAAATTPAVVAAGPLAHPASLAHPGSLRLGDPLACLPLLHFVLLKYSRHVCAHTLACGIEVRD
jgi:hypothetical protein